MNQAGEGNIKTDNIVNEPLILAYIGDAVYEMYVRTILVKGKRNTVHNLHRMSTDYVKAKAQSDIIHAIMNELTQEEADVVRRGRNAKSGTIPKNADVTEYKYATGLESLIGFLYLRGMNSRLIEILELCVKQVCRERAGEDPCPERRE
ncbi:MAG: ribonuclease III domain-containing protein [Eubacteriales bacterium]|nr:ribonuclease III domain-containing protein [Eubacteriales bacterium]